MYMYVHKMPLFIDRSQPNANTSIYFACGTSMLPAVFKPSPMVFYVANNVPSRDFPDTIYHIPLRTHATNNLKFASDQLRRAFYLEDKGPCHPYHSCITPRPFQACVANEFRCDRSMIKGTFI